MLKVYKDDQIDLMNKKNKKLISLKPSASEITDLATRALSSIAASVPLAYEPIKFLFASGALFTSQSIVKIGSEIQDFLKTKKVIDEDKQKLPKRKLYETLKFLHNSPTLDDDFVEALKNLHILTFAADSTAEEVSEIYILLETARKLNGPEISILLSAYRIYNRSYSSNKMEDILKENGGNINTGHSKRWCIMIAKACGYSLPEYVESRQQILEELRLIVPRGYNQHTVDSRDENFNPAGKFRLTDFGHKLVEYIVKGDNLLGNKN